MPGPPVAGVFAACCWELGPEIVASGWLLSRRSSAAQGAPGTRLAVWVALLLDSQYRSFGSTTVTAPWESGRMVTAHFLVFRSSQWALVTVPPVTVSMSFLGKPYPTHTDSLNTMLKVKPAAPSWEAGTLVNWAVSGCSDERGVSLAASSNPRTPPPTA